MGPNPPRFERRSYRLLFFAWQSKSVLLAEMAIHWPKSLKDGSLHLHPVDNAGFRGSLSIRCLVVPHKMTHVAETYKTRDLLDTQK